MRNTRCRFARDMLNPKPSKLLRTLLRPDPPESPSEEPPRIAISALSLIWIGLVVARIPRPESVVETSCSSRTMAGIDRSWNVPADAAGSAGSRGADDQRSRRGPSFPQDVQNRNHPPASRSFFPPPVILLDYLGEGGGTGLAGCGGGGCGQGRHAQCGQGAEAGKYLSPVHLDPLPNRPGSTLPELGRGIQTPHRCLFQGLFPRFEDVRSFCILGPQKRARGLRTSVDRL